MNTTYFQIYSDMDHVYLNSVQGYPNHPQLLPLRNYIESELLKN